MQSYVISHVQHNDSRERQVCAIVVKVFAQPERPLEEVRPSQDLIKVKWVNQLNVLNDYTILKNVKCKPLV